MGICAPKPKKVTFDVHYAASPQTPPPPTATTVRLYGSADCPATSRIRVALLYKAIAVEFFPSGGGPALDCCGDTVAGSAEAILEYIDAKLPGPPILGRGSGAPPGAAVAASLQHRSIERHVERLVAWAEELVASGGRAAAAEGRRRGMEVRRLGRSYAELVEVMLEHAQMEERVVFPALEKADPGSCRAANEEHARDLPIMNGIKEDVKSITVLDPGNPAYQEALLNFSLRLHTLQENCREHFAEEERELLPLLEAAERCGSCRMEGAVEQLVEVMEATHSRLFNYLMAGLLPREAMQYLEVVCRCRDRQRVLGMLRSLESQLEAAGTAATTPLGKLLKATQ